MLTRILLAAILAGVLSGVFASAVQAYRVSPLILQAEVYENAGDVAIEEHSQEDATAAGHAHAVEVWGPKDGWERTLYTTLANILVGVAFSMILTAGVLMTKSALTIQSGFVWGAGGFLAFVLAPNFGLSPELPGMIAADLGDRQAWWVATVLATISALLIFAFKKNLVWMLAGLVLLVAPHIYGAPVSPTDESLIPANLAAEFVVATIVSSLLFWLFLGGVLGWLVERVTRAQPVSGVQNGN